MQILFVEDDAMNRRVVRDMLLVGGVDMTEAEDAEMGLRLIDANNYDVILMDLRMPGIDGLTAISMIRARDDEKAHTPVIVITADTETNLRAKCIAQGADDLLLKPIVMESLFESIGHIIATRYPGEDIPI